MNFTNSPTEQTTAFTEVLVFLVAMVAIGYMGFYPAAEQEKIIIWIAAFGFIAAASLLGACAHGIVFPDKIHDRIWRVLNLCLGLAVSLFVGGVVHDLAGTDAALRTLPFVVTAGVIFFVLTWRFPGIFFIFIIYEAAALFFALAAYGWLAFIEKSPGAIWMTAGVLTSLIAAVVQAIHSVKIQIVWSFDHNGVFHIIQAAGLLLLLRGILA